VAAGRLGRKSGAGFYRYEEGRRGDVDPEFTDAPARALAGDRIRERIEHAIAEEAVIAVGDGVAAREDVITALRLGAGHPERFLSTL
jgi:3-hydroxyacyl-CoA dehydrogenase